MPGYDGTGPSGEGPMTGGARGNCADGSEDYRPRGLFRRPLGSYFRRGQAQGQEPEPSGLEQKSEPAPEPDSVESKVGTGLGPCGNGIPRGGGRGLGRGYHGGR